MAQYKRSREENYCNSINNNERENPPKRSCSTSDAEVLLPSDLLLADDDYNINAQDLHAARDALLLDRLTSLDQEIDYCNKRINSSVSDAEVRCSIYSPNLWESALADSSCKMDDEICTVSIEYLLHATDEELGIPPNPEGEICTANIEYLLHATDEELGIPPNPLSDDEATFDSHDTDFWDGLMLPIEHFSGIEIVNGTSGHFIPTHAI